MSTLSTTQRQHLPLADFGWPAKRLYPIVDQSDVAAASHLIGKAPASVQSYIKARIIAICKRKGFTIPAAWQPNA